MRRQLAIHLALILASPFATEETQHTMPVRKCRGGGGPTLKPNTRMAPCEIPLMPMGWDWATRTAAGPSNHPWAFGLPSLATDCRPGTAATPESRGASPGSPARPWHARGNMAAGMPSSRRHTPAPARTTPHTYLIQNMSQQLFPLAGIHTEARIIPSDSETAIAQT